MVMTMPARSRVEFDPMRMGVRIAVSLWGGEGESAVLTWPSQPERAIVRGEAEPEADTWLRLPEDAARAMYEALAQYFGGAADSATLRRDYDAERARVDVFIRHLTSGS
ncbi:hypothetical protein MHY85_05200 [Cellulomonas sp. ACRRI]|uniref:hypothetical protein n=1 Tax=Cellulomonas sp. ACRRI TaxID=2918188 RepID=UPI001EF38EBF|nr:hypothetical protein [Cellulomonas sp. ACRRI]MCG7285372.1 hypothetical protein [Cellulomonas sp. ACRRI]